MPFSVSFQHEIRGKRTKMQGDLFLAEGAKITWKLRGIGIGGAVFSV